MVFDKIVPESLPYRHSEFSVSACSDASAVLFACSARNAAAASESPARAPVTLVVLSLYGACMSSSLRSAHRQSFRSCLPPPPADEGPDDSASHSKATLSGSSITVPISNGKLALGTWQVSLPPRPFLLLQLGEGRTRQLTAVRCDALVVGHLPHGVPPHEPQPAYLRHYHSVKGICSLDTREKTRTRGRRARMHRIPALHDGRRVGHSRQPGQPRVRREMEAARCV
jgi:hypothetical protein